MNAEHLALREGVGMIDLAPFVIFDISGPGTLDYLQHLTVNNCDVAVGRSVYTPLLDPQGGFRSDLTMMRARDDEFRVVTGAFDGPAMRTGSVRTFPTTGRSRSSTTPRRSRRSVCGARRRAALVESITSDDISDAALPYGTTAEVLIGSIPVRLFRISYVGEHGWEVYVPPTTRSRSGTGCGRPARRSA